MNELYKTTTRFDDDCYLRRVPAAAADGLHPSAAPRVLFVGYGETDDWAHAGRYDNVLESAQQFDHYVEQLWNTMQSMPAYHDRTTFILTTDHGRGSGRSQWKEHGVEQKGSENIWIAVLGPDTPGLGERANIAAVTQSQIAATVAAFWARIIGRRCRRGARVAGCDCRFRRTISACAAARRCDDSNPPAARGE